MGTEGKPEKTKEVKEDGEGYEEIIKRMEEKHPELRAQRTARKKKPELGITLEQMFTPEKAANMRREAEMRDRQTPRDSR